MPKVALYARYSTDNQSVVSIEDQFRICRERRHDCFQHAYFDIADLIREQGFDPFLAEQSLPVELALIQIHPKKAHEIWRG